MGARYAVDRMGMVSGLDKVPPPPFGVVSAMIGTFTFCSASRDAVSIKLFWDGSRRSAIVSVPDHVEEILGLDDLPVNESMNLESALPYAIFVAMKSECSINICGDRSVWNESWGRLNSRH